MTKGFPRFGAKPSPASPGEYARDFGRSIKKKTRRKKHDYSGPRVEFRPSTKPVPAELTRPDTSIRGFGALGIIFLICLVLFLALALLG